MHLFFFALSSGILATAYAAAAAAAAAHLQSARHVLASMPKNYGFAMERRQETECIEVEPGDLFCERSCGPLFTACVFYNSCYRPSLGQTCCQDGGYCPAGSYCTTLGCCIIGSSLEDCTANLISEDTAIDSSVPATFFATTPATLVVTSPLVTTTPPVVTSPLVVTNPLVATNSLVVTTSRLEIPTLIASSNSGVPTLSVSSVSTSPNRQTSESLSDLPSNTRTTTDALPKITSSPTPTSNSGSKNSEDIIGLLSGLLGFLLML